MMSTMLVGGVGAGAGQIQIQSLPSANTTVTVPWVVAGDQSWRNGPPTFTLREDGVSITARGWIAMTTDELLVRVVVHDDVHLNDQTGGSIWNGDFLRLSVDAWGDGTGSEPADTAAAFGPDDASIGFALSSKAGSIGWVFNSRNPVLHDAYPTELLDFHRDETTQTTTYDIRLPWKLVASAAGLTPQFGISVIVRSVNSADQKTPEHLRWGGNESAFQPGKFVRVQAGLPPQDAVTALALRSELWSPALPLVAQVAVASTAAQVLMVVAGTETNRLEVAGTPGRTAQRYQIECRPAVGAETTPLRVTVQPAGTELVLTPKLPGRVIEDLAARVDELLRTSPHPLFTRHLLSVKALVTTEWARAVTEAECNTTAVAEVSEFAEKILAGLRGDAGRWESYWRDGRPLRLAFTSKTDNTLQSYALTLPKSWDPSENRDEQAKFPLFVELHGSGHPSPLSAMAQQYDAAPTAETQAVSLRRAFACVQRAGYHILPHGRGNLGYKGVGEADVWEALADFTQAFRYDEDRQYLYGFSMGGGGTWRLATRTPDRWAAIAMYAPAILWLGAPPWIVAENLRALPVWTWTGEADTLLKDQRQAMTALQRFGKVPVVQTTPNMGHQYLREMQEKGINWLQQFTRKRPDRFSFVADTDEHLGVWGIEIKRDVTMSAIPRFECRLEGNTIHLDSTGIPGLTINAGAGGLGLTGEVKVVWNGKESYRGQVRIIELPVQDNNSK